MQIPLGRSDEVANPGLSIPIEFIGEAKDDDAWPCLIAVKEELAEVEILCQDDSPGLSCMIQKFGVRCVWPPDKRGSDSCPPGASRRGNGKLFVIHPQYRIVQARVDILRFEIGVSSEDLLAGPALR